MYVGPSTYVMPTLLEVGHSRSPRGLESLHSRRGGRANWCEFCEFLWIRGCNGRKFLRSLLFKFHWLLVVSAIDPPGKFATTEITCQFLKQTWIFTIFTKKCDYHRGNSIYALRDWLAPLRVTASTGVSTMCVAIACRRHGSQFCERSNPILKLKR